MKLFSLFLISALITNYTQAVTLTTTFKNLNGVNDSESSLVFSDNTGAVVAKDTGFIAIGTFIISNAEIASLNSSANIDSAFMQFGSGGDFSVTDGAFETLASGDPDAVFDGVNSYTGKNVYIVIGNGSSLAASTEFLVWDSGLKFENTEPTGSPDEVTLHAGTGDLVIGRDDKDTYDLSGLGGSATEAAFTLVQVPEPSSTALLGLGGLAMLLRRRR